MRNSALYELFEALEMKHDRRGYETERKTWNHHANRRPNLHEL